MFLFDFHICSETASSTFNSAKQPLLSERKGRLPMQLQLLHSFTLLAEEELDEVDKVEHCDFALSDFHDAVVPAVKSK